MPLNFPTLPPQYLYALLAWIEGCYAFGLDKTLVALGLMLAYALLARCPH